MDLRIGFEIDLVYKFNGKEMEKYRAGVDEKERKPDQEQVLWEDKADNEEKGEGGEE